MSVHLTWIKTAADDAVINGIELQLWLGISGKAIGKLMRNSAFPAPKFHSSRSRPPREFDIKRTRWRVGDVRGWLNACTDLAKETA